MNSATYFAKILLQLELTGRDATLSSPCEGGTPAIVRGLDIMNDLWVVKQDGSVCDGGEEHVNAPFCIQDVKWSES